MLQDTFFITLIAAAGGGFMGAFGFWAITKIEEWLWKPRITIEFGQDYPFRSEALFADGQSGEFIEYE